MKPQHHFPMISPREPQNNVFPITAGSPPPPWSGFSCTLGRMNPSRGEVLWVSPESSGCCPPTSTRPSLSKTLPSTNPLCRSALRHAEGGLEDQDSILTGKHACLLSSQPTYNPHRCLGGSKPTPVTFQPTQAMATFRCQPHLPVCPSTICTHTYFLSPI